MLFGNRGVFANPAYSLYLIADTRDGRPWLCALKFQYFLGSVHNSSVRKILSAKARLQGEKRSKVGTLRAFSTRQARFWAKRLPRDELWTDPRFMPKLKSKITSGEPQIIFLFPSVLLGIRNKDRHKRFQTAFACNIDNGLFINGLFIWIGIIHFTIGIVRFWDWHNCTEKKGRLKISFRRPFFEALFGASEGVVAGFAAGAGVAISNFDFFQAAALRGGV